MGRPWNAHGFFQGKFMPQLINNYASSFLHSLSGRGDGYGADTLSLLMPPTPTPPHLFSHIFCHHVNQGPTLAGGKPRILPPPDGTGHLCLWSACGPKECPIIDISQRLFNICEQIFPMFIIESKKKSNYLGALKDSFKLI